MMGQGVYSTERGHTVAPRAPHHMFSIHIHLYGLASYTARDFFERSRAVKGTRASFDPSEPS